MHPRNSLYQDAGLLPGTGGCNLRGGVMLSLTRIAVGAVVVGCLLRYLFATGLTQCG